MASVDHQADGGQRGRVPESQLIPNSTPIPNVALDLILPFLYESEAKVLLYILRRTYGFERPEQFEQIALTQFAGGIG